MHGFNEYNLYSDVVLIGDFQKANHIDELLRDRFKYNINTINFINTTRRSGSKRILIRSAREVDDNYNPWRRGHVTKQVFGISLMIYNQKQTIMSQIIKHTSCADTLGYILFDVTRCVRG